MRTATVWLHKPPTRCRMPEAALLSDGGKIGTMTETTAADISSEAGLLTNDALIVAAMRASGIRHLVTNDDDFDRVPGITVWKPR